MFKQNHVSKLQLDNYYSHLDIKLETKVVNDAKKFNISSRIQIQMNISDI